MSNDEPFDVIAMSGNIWSNNYGEILFTFPTGLINILKSPGVKLKFMRHKLWVYTS